MKKTYRARIARLTASMIAVTIIAGAAPAMASAVKGESPWRSSFAPKIVPAEKWVERKIEPAAETTEELGKTTEKKEAPVPEPVKVATYSSTAGTGGSSSGSAATKASSTSKRSGSDLATAQSILAGLIGKYPILSGTTVSFGDARGYQAIAYYKSGRIVIDPNHTRSLSTILNHEVWHVIDWRDNGQIDWGENVPPK